MSETSVTIHSGDPLRLTFCPRCDYSLQGLPDEGNCPECGREYDQAFVVLRGRPAMNHETGAFSRRAVLLNFAVIALAVIVISSIHRGALHNPFLLVLLVFGVLIVGVGLAGSLSSVRPGEVLIWLSPVGAGQQSPVDPSSLPAKIHRWLEYLTPLVVVLWPLVGSRHYPIYYILEMALVIGVLLYVRRAGRPPVSKPPDGIRPALYAWSVFDWTDLEPLGENRYRLQASYTSWVKQWYVVNAVIEASDADAEELRSRIARWGGVRVLRN